LEKKNIIELEGYRYKESDILDNIKTLWATNWKKIEEQGKAHDEL
jgi:hypothetical protein